MMQDGMIELDNPELPSEWGFTGKRFGTDSYLWKEGNEIWISLVVANAEGSGHFKELVDKIEADGFGVVVPAPYGKLTSILNKWGFKPRTEPFGKEYREVWRRNLKENA